MAQTSEEERRERRRQRLTRGLFFGAAALGLPALYNAWHARRASETVLPSWGDPSYLPTAFGNLAYRDMGGLGDAGGSASRPTTLLLHSLAPGHSSSHWQSVAQRLAVDHRVLTLDWPGWGDSERRRMSYGAELFAESLELLHRARTPSSLVVVAVGLAAVPTIRWLARSPRVAERLVLVCPRGRAPAPRQVRDNLLRGLLALPILGTSAIHMATERRALEARLRSSFCDPSKIPARLLDEHERFSHLPKSAFPLHAYLTGKLESDALAEWADLSLPTRLVWGRSSSDPEVAEADLWLQERDAQLTVVENAGSLPHLEAPEAMIEILLHELSTVTRA